MAGIPVHENDDSDKPSENSRRKNDDYRPSHVTGHWAGHPKWYQCCPSDNKRQGASEENESHQSSIFANFVVVADGTSPNQSSLDHFRIGNTAISVSVCEIKNSWCTTRFPTGSSLADLITSLIFPFFTSTIAIIPRHVFGSLTG